jgi:hypothetical protein
MGNFDVPGLEDLVWFGDHAEDAQGALQEAKGNPEETANVMLYLLAADPTFADYFFELIEATWRFADRIETRKAEWDANGWPANYEKVLKRARYDAQAAKRRRNRQK